jgi:glycosyltransferase involved in cell wall biosynthesis
MIAVLTTVRNGMPFIKEAVMSVRDQVLEDYRHWVVDDGSTDGTRAYLEAEQGGRLTVVLGPSIGRGRALNAGVTEADAEFIAILDADDVAGPIWLAEMRRIMQQNADIAVLTCHAAFAKKDMDISADGQDVVRQILPDVFLYRNPVSHSGTLIRRRVLIDAGGYDESRTSLFDYELWVRLLCRGHQIWGVDKSYIFKRIHGGQHFESRKRFSYLLGCYHLRRQVSRELLHGNGKIIPLLGFLYGLLPQAFRHWRYNRFTSRNAD